MNFVTKTLAAVALSAALPAMAGSYTGIITAFNIWSDGTTFVTMNGTTGHGACSSGSSPYWIIKDETTVAGKITASILMGAYLSGRTVTVYGVNTCTRLSGVEDISQVAAQ